MRYHHSCLILSDLVLPSPSLFKVGLAEINGPKKEIYNVTAIWLRLIATTHQEDVAQVTMLIQQWFNLFGRWPITIAFFVAAAPREAKDRYAEDVPEGVKGEVYEAAMWFKAYLTDLAKIHYALPMIPVFWEVSRLMRLVFGSLGIDLDGILVLGDARWVAHGDSCSFCVSNRTTLIFGWLLLGYA